MARAFSLVVDEKTGLPSKIIYQGGQGPVEQIYSDWREVNGIRLPFAWTHHARREEVR